MRNVVIVPCDGRADALNCLFRLPVKFLKRAVGQLFNDARVIVKVCRAVHCVYPVEHFARERKMEVVEQVRHKPRHQRDITLFALATGLRQGNVTGLKWAQIDLIRQTGWIPAEEAKGDEDIHISLSDLAIKVLARQVGKHDERVFTYAGRPVRHVSTKAWRGALQRAGITNFRWHDLRHTWASWLVQNGTPLYDLQEMGGWKSAEMVRRYAHLAPAQMAKHAAVISALLHDTNTAQEGMERTAAPTKKRLLASEPGQ
jgi:integrase